MFLVQTTRGYLRLAALAVLAVCLTPSAAVAQNEWWRGLRHRTVWVWLGTVDSKTRELTTPPVHRMPDIAGVEGTVPPKPGDIVEFTSDVPLRILNYKRRGERDRFESWWGHEPNGDDLVAMAPRGTTGVVNDVHIPQTAGDRFSPLWVRITPWAEATDTRTVTDLILLGDPAALQMAGGSGNHAFIPALKAVAGRRGYNPLDDDASSRWAYWALAKLGDRDTLQIFWCAMLRETSSPPLHLASYVGGWFGYQALVAVFEGAAEDAQRKGIAKEAFTDVGVSSTQYDALREIILMTKGGDPNEWFPLPGNLVPAMAAWREWALTSPHLRTLQPAGDGVDFSNDACQKGRPRKRR